MEIKVKVHDNWPPEMIREANDEGEKCLVHVEQIDLEIQQDRVIVLYVQTTERHLDISFCADGGNFWYFFLRPIDSKEGQPTTITVEIPKGEDNNWHAFWSNSKSISHICLYLPNREQNLVYVEPEEPDDQA